MCAMGQNFNQWDQNMQLLRNQLQSDKWRLQTQL